MMSENKKKGLQPTPRSTVLVLDEEDVTNDEAVIQEAIARGDVATIQRLSGKWAEYQIANTESVNDQGTGLPFANPFGLATGIFSSGEKQNSNMKAARQNMAYIEDAKSQAERNYNAINNLPYIPTTAEGVTLTSEEIAKLYDMADNSNWGQKEADKIQENKTAEYVANYTKSWVEKSPGVYTNTSENGADKEYTLEQVQEANLEWSKKTGLTPLANGDVAKLVDNGNGFFVDEEGNDYTSAISFEPFLYDDNQNPINSADAKSSYSAGEAAAMLADNGQNPDGTSTGGNAGGAGTAEDPLVYIGGDSEFWPYIQRVLDNEAAGMDKAATAVNSENSIINGDVGANITSALDSPLTPAPSTTEEIK